MEFTQHIPSFLLAGWVFVLEHRMAQEPALSAEELLIVRVKLSSLVTAEEWEGAAQLGELCLDSLLSGGPLARASCVIKAANVERI